LTGSPKVANQRVSRRGNDYFFLSIFPSKPDNTRLM
jgi:hypothetical protein